MLQELHVYFTESTSESTKRVAENKLRSPVRDEGEDESDERDAAAENGQQRDDTFFGQLLPGQHRNVMVSISARVEVLHCRHLWIIHVDNRDTLFGES